MKKLFAIILVLLAFSGCSGEKQEIEFLIPAGSTESFVFSEETFLATKDKIIITAGAGFNNTSITIKTEKVSEEYMFEPVYLSHEKPVSLKVEEGDWFKIGVSVQNPSEHNIAVSIYVQNVDIKS